MPRKDWTRKILEKGIPLAQACGLWLLRQKDEYRGRLGEG
jgi:hypothetical protein